jgi:2-polyprenyl-3-methyl-5-hydroxy-6-metoxy-1,4-benzoquinol methylase
MPECRICGAGNKEQKIRAPHVFGGREEHDFWQCDKCDGIYLYPVLTEDEEKRFYLQEFEKFMSTRVGDHRDWSNAEKHKVTNQDQVVRRLPFVEQYLKENVELLEIGCSSGFMLDAFRERGAKCMGVEPSGEFSEFLTQSGYEHVSDISDLEGKKFDVITHFFVFEHISDPFSFLETIQGLLKDGGVMIAEIPCANDPLTSIYDIEAFEKFYWSIAHHYYFTPKSIKYILDKLGYKYELVPEQRYDLSNHMVWMNEGRPGGQGKYHEQIGDDVNNVYSEHLKKTWQCDTMFLYMWK